MAKTYGIDTSRLTPVQRTEHLSQINNPANSRAAFGHEYANGNKLGDPAWLKFHGIGSNQPVMNEHLDYTPPQVGHTAVVLNQTAHRTNVTDALNIGSTLVNPGKELTIVGLGIFGGLTQKLLTLVGRAPAVAKVAAGKTVGRIGPDATDIQWNVRNLTPEERVYYTELRAKEWLPTAGGRRYTEQADTYVAEARRLADEIDPSNFRKTVKQMDALSDELQSARPNRTTGLSRDRHLEDGYGNWLGSDVDNHLFPEVFLPASRSAWEAIEQGLLKKGAIPLQGGLDPSPWFVDIVRLTPDNLVKHHRFLAHHKGQGSLTPAEATAFNEWKKGPGEYFQRIQASE